MKFSIKDFFSKCDLIRRKLWIWSHLLEKSLNGKSKLLFYSRIEQDCLSKKCAKSQSLGY